MITFIIVNYKGEKYLENCLLSIKSQTYKSYEIIVVNNSPYEDISESIRLKFKDDVIFFQSEKNSGYAGGANQGIKIAKGKYCVVMNNDIYLDSNWASEVIKVLESSTDIGVVSSKLLYMHEPNKINAIGQVFYKDLWAMNEALEEDDAPQFNQPKESFGPCGAVAIYRKEIFDKVGLLDEDYFLYLEDFEFHWRIHLAGYKCLYVPSAFAYHEHSPGLGRYTLSKLYYSERNRIWTVIKILPLELLLSSFIFTLIRYFVMLSIFLRKDKTKKRETVEKISKFEIIKTILKAWWDAMLKIRIMLQKRKEIYRFNTLSKKEVKDLMNKFYLPISRITVK